MRQFAAHYPNFGITPRAVAQLSWGHISVLIHKVKDDSIRTWYAEQMIKHGWSCLTLEHHLKNNIYLRQGISSVKASNYLTCLPFVNLTA